MKYYLYFVHKTKAEREVVVVGLGVRGGEGTGKGNGLEGDDSIVMLAIPQSNKIGRWMLVYHFRIHSFKTARQSNNQSLKEQRRKTKFVECYLSPEGGVGGKA